MKTLLISFYDLNSFGVRTLHSALKREKIEVDSLFFKCQNPNNTEDKPTEEEKDLLVNFIIKKGYKVVGFSFRSFLFSLIAELSAKIKQHPNPPLIVFGGVQSTLNPSRCIKHSDVVVVGEGEQTLIDICSNKDLKDIENIYYKNGDEIIKNNITCVVEQDLDKIPFPDFSDEDKYFLNGSNIKPLETFRYKTKYSIMTSRGCPFGCSYCSNNYLRKLYTGKYVRRRSVDNVIKELIQAKESFPNLMGIAFWDDVFTFDKEWIKEFVVKYRREINLPFRCFIHPMNCDEDIIKMLSNAGLQSVEMGVQTFSDKIRKNYLRSETTEQVLRACKILRFYGIKFSMDLIIDDPLQTEEDLKDNLDALLKIKPKFTVHPLTLTLFPETELANRYLEEDIISTNELEDNLGEGWTRWSPCLDAKRDKLNLLYDCLYYLSQSRYRSKYLIQKIQNSSYFRKNPEALARFLRFFSFELFSLDWNSRFDRYKFFISQGVLSVFKQPVKFTYLKVKQRFLDPEVLNL